MPLALPKRKNVRRQRRAAVNEDKPIKRAATVPVPTGPDAQIVLIEIARVLTESHDQARRIVMAVQAPTVPVQIVRVEEIVPARIALVVLVDKTVPARIALVVLVDKTVPAQIGRAVKIGQVQTAPVPIALGETVQALVVPAWIDQIGEIGPVLIGSGAPVDRIGRQVELMARQIVLTTGSQGQVAPVLTAPVLTVRVRTVLVAMTVPEQIVPALADLAVTVQVPTARVQVALARIVLGRAAVMQTVPIVLGVVD